VSIATQALATHELTIPQFGERQATESLNVASATAILLSEFMRITEM
jgi:TrmH family RNA methyltransferase